MGKMRVKGISSDTDDIEDISAFSLGLRESSLINKAKKIFS